MSFYFYFYLFWGTEIYGNELKLKENNNWTNLNVRISTVQKPAELIRSFHYFIKTQVDGPFGRNWNTAVVFTVTLQKKVTPKKVHSFLSFNGITEKTLNHLFQTGPNRTSKTESLLCIFCNLIVSVLSPLSCSGSLNSGIWQF